MASQACFWPLPFRPVQVSYYSRFINYGRVASEEHDCIVKRNAGLKEVQPCPRISMSGR